MKYISICLLFGILLLMTGCASVKTKAASDQTSTVVQDGSSYEKAIKVKDIDSEYKWVRENYPAGKVGKQSLAFQGKKPFDILQVNLPDGSKKDIYFDISSFFGKM